MLVPSPSMRELLRARLQAYEAQFEGAPEALTYWESRGLTKEVGKAFLVGFVADPLKGDRRFQGRLAIPYLTPSGVVSFKFRAIDGSPERFMKDKGDPNRLFNTRVLQRARKVVITEGELDCVAAAQCGLQAVGIPGANNWRREWTRVFYNREVTVLADGDDAGREFGERVREQVYSSKVIDMPDGEDVCSMLLAKGEDWIKELVLG